MNTTKWLLDPAHSEITFKVRHMMITNVTGMFQKFDVKAEMDGDDVNTLKVDFNADVTSVTTNSEQRDGHLKSPDFFDAEHFPELLFKSGKVEKNGKDGHYKLHGDLTIKGQTKPIIMDVEFGGIAKDPWGNTKAGFNLEGVINRKEFGLTWNAATESGGLLVGEDVKIHAGIQLTKQN